MKKKIELILIIILCIIGFFMVFYILPKNNVKDYKYTNSIKVLTVEGDTAIIITHRQRVDIVVNKNITNIKLNENRNHEQKRN